MTKRSPWIYSAGARIYDRFTAVQDQVVRGGRQARIDFALSCLCLEPGDVVADLGCGTGALIEALSQAVGPEGCVIGVDISDEMLSVARQRIATLGLTNVTLECADMRDYAPPDPVAAVLARNSIEIANEPEAAFANALASLRPGGRIVVTGTRRPESARWIAKAIGAMIVLPLGVRDSAPGLCRWVERDCDCVQLRFFPPFESIYVAAGSKRA